MSRYIGVQGRRGSLALAVEKQVITRARERERESHRTPSHLHRHPAQKIFIGRQNGKFLESFRSALATNFFFKFSANN